MRPSPRIVAPEMPRMPEICGPTGLTTISRLPISSSATRPVECSPARTSTTGIVTSCSGSGEASMPTYSGQRLQAVFLAAVAEAGAVARAGASSPRRAAARTTPSTVGSGSA